ncbi:hypothetical protein ACIP39_01915 [Streptomyces tibetensis]|uniref:hypothetical protein n=1 Tax=Streptomyces tibetensis TaxID=2382123 RepID=UPI00382B7475
MSRRHTREYDRFIKHSESLITRAAIALMTRRLTRTEEMGSLIRDWKRQPLRHGRPTVSQLRFLGGSGFSPAVALRAGRQLFLRR